MTNKGPAGILWKIFTWSHMTYHMIKLPISGLRALSAGTSDFEHVLLYVRAVASTASPGTVVVKALDWQTAVLTFWICSSLHTAFYSAALNCRACNQYAHKSRHHRGKRWWGFDSRSSPEGWLWRDCFGTSSKHYCNYRSGEPPFECHIAGCHPYQLCYRLRRPMCIRGLVWIQRHVQHWLALGWETSLRSAVSQFL